MRATYAQPRTLRAGTLSTPFDVWFDEGFLVIRKSNGVERRIDRDEFRAVVRALDSGASSDAVQVISGNAQYIVAIRDDLGLERGDLDDDEGDIERALLLEAVKRTSEIAKGIGQDAQASESESDLPRLVAELTVALEVERAERDEVIRETVRLRAALDQSEAAKVELHERCERLEAALPSAVAQKGGSPTIREDVNDLLVRSARSAATEIAPGSRWANVANVTIELYGRDIGATVAKCRIIIDELVQAQWLATFGGEEVPPFKNFQALAQELNDQAGVDLQRLALLRTLYRLCNPGAHRLDAVTPRRAAFILYAVVDQLSSEPASAS